MRGILTATMIGLVAAGALAGCGTVRSARDRIVKREPVCQDMTVQIYFEPGSAAVTREGRAVLRAAADQARGCHVDQVSVLGLADAAGSVDANLQLSKRRVASVTAALAAVHLPAAEFDLKAAGQAGAVTSAGAAAPLRRRADVTLKLSPLKR